MLLLFPDWLPFIWTEGVHKCAARHHHWYMHKQGKIFTRGQGLWSHSIWGSQWCLLHSSITVHLQAARFVKDRSCTQHTAAAHGGCSWETATGGTWAPTAFQNSLQRGWIAQNPEVTKRNGCARWVQTTGEKSLKEEATGERHRNWHTSSACIWSSQAAKVKGWWGL